MLNAAKISSMTTALVFGLALSVTLCGATQAQEPVSAALTISSRGARPVTPRASATITSISPASTNSVSRQPIRSMISWVKGTTK